jgi:hypothetical protein
MPAALTTVSMRPNRSTVAATRASQSGREETSAKGAAAVSRHLRGSFRQPLLGSAGDHHGRSFLKKPVGNGGADTGTTAGYDSYSSFKSL